MKVSSAYFQDVPMSALVKWIELVFVVYYIEVACLAKL